MDPKETGRFGEALAAEFYASKGYRILERNWRWSNKGEIDLIAADENKGVLAVCEVKTRSPDPMVRPCAAVDHQKQKKLRILAQIYCMRHPELKTTYDIRFDVVEIILKNQAEYTIHFLPGAF